MMTRERARALHVLLAEHQPAGRHPPLGRLPLLRRQLQRKADADAHGTAQADAGRIEPDLRAADDLRADIDPGDLAQAGETFEPVAIVAELHLRLQRQLQ